MKGNLLIGLICLSIFYACNPSASDEDSKPTETPVIEEPEVELTFGFPLEEYRVVEGEIKSGQVLSQVLYPLGVTAQEIDELITAGAAVFDVRKIKPGQEWFALFEESTDSVPSHFIYEKNPKDYIVVDFGDSITVRAEEKPIIPELRSTKGVITSSLYQTLDDQNAPAELALDLSSIYAWTIDFYRLQEGDEFEILYEEDLVDGETFGSRRILACRFIHNGKELKAYRYLQDSTYNYFDDGGASLRKTFLKAPVKFSRISSRFTKKRYHPVLKRYKAHLGTDYAAPSGTPIVAVGDGTVIKSSYTSGNGKYVKIRHNGTYETQYLHMSKRAVKVGEYVTQGQVIGYVGSTGLATGPHVCFRFWKNGKQIDHFSEEFPPSDPIPADKMEPYRLEQKRLEHLLDSMLTQIDTSSVAPVVANIQ